MHNMTEQMGVPAETQDWSLPVNSTLFAKVTVHFYSRIYQLVHRREV